MTSKYALTVAINKYNGAPLRGCIQDSKDMEDILKIQGFTVCYLRDEDATKAKILAKVEEIGKLLVPGDIFVIHYSGHGSQIPCRDGSEVDGLTEILCPFDLIKPDGSWTSNYITDDEIARLLAKVPSGVTVEFFLDCCHSGTLTREIGTRPSTDTSCKSRYLSAPDVGEQKAVLQPFKPQSVHQGAKVITWTGCRDDQTSADAFLNHVYRGAFTASLIYAMSSEDRSRTKVYERLVQNIQAQGFSQCPQLDCDTVNLRGSVFSLATPIPTPSIVQNVKDLVSKILQGGTQ